MDLHRGDRGIEDYCWKLVGNHLLMHRSILKSDERGVFVRSFSSDIVAVCYCVCFVSVLHLCYVKEIVNIELSKWNVLFKFSTSELIRNFFPVLRFYDFLITLFSEAKMIYFVRII